MSYKKTVLRKMEWDALPIYDLAEWTNGLAFRNIQFSDSGRPVIKINELKHGITGQTQFTQDSFDENYRLKKGDLLFSWSGSPNTSIDAFWYKLSEGWLNQHIFKVKPREVVTNDFLYYLLKANMPRFIRIARDKQTTGLGHVTIADLKRFIVSLPPRQEQEKIAEILSSLDNKIELNRAINRNLENLSSALFKRWFIDFYLPNDDGKRDKLVESNGLNSRKLPKGWEIVPVTDLINVLGGGTPKTDNGIYWGDEIPFFTPRDVEDSAYVTSTEKYLTQEGLRNCSSRLYPINTVFITARGTVGKIIMAGVPMAMNQSCYALEGKQDIGQFFVYELIKKVVEELKKKTHGSVFETITTDTFRQTSFVRPNPNFLKKYESAAGPIFNKIHEGVLENDNLISVRNLLLSRLVSGKIEVPLKEARSAKKSKTPEPFRDAALVADLIANFAGSYPLTRYRYTKYSYFVKRYLGQDASMEYAQMPGGPYNPKMRYNGPESILIKKQYAKYNGTGFVAGPKISEILGYAQRYGFVSGISFVREELIGKTNDELELLSTVDYAMLNLGKKGNQNPQTIDVVSEIKSEAVWAPKLTKQHFTHDKITQAIQWLRTRQLKYGY